MNRLRFSLSSLLILTLIVASATAYLSHCRQKGRDALIRSLEDANAQLVPLDQANKSTQIQLAKYDYPLTYWTKLLGTSKKPINEIWFTHSALNPENTRSLSYRNPSNAISVIRFHLVEIDENAVMFFKNWREVNHLEIRDTRLPNAWLSQLKLMPNLQSIVISGGVCNLEMDHLTECQSLRLIRLADRGIGAKELDKIKLRFPNALVQLVAGHDSHSTWKTGKTFSEHNPDAYSEMKSVWNQLHELLANLTPAATNQFNSPATVAEIAAVERELGMPLHPSVRALLEVHNGQPSWHDELVGFEQLLDTQRILKDYQLYQSFVGYDPRPYDFDPFFPSTFNPNLIPIGSSDDNQLTINLVDGSVWEFYSESESPIKQADNLIEYLEMIIGELEAGHYEYGKGGQVRLNGFGPDEWKKNN